MLIDPRWELFILAEEAMEVLVEAPNGEKGMLSREKLVDYARIENKLIPKSKVDWIL